MFRRRRRAWPSRTGQASGGHKLPGVGAGAVGLLAPQPHGLGSAMRCGLRASRFPTRTAASFFPSRPTGPRRCRRRRGGAGRGSVARRSCARAEASQRQVPASGSSGMRPRRRGCLCITEAFGGGRTRPRDRLDTVSSGAGHWGGSVPGGGRSHGTEPGRGSGRCLLGHLGIAVEGPGAVRGTCGWGWEPERGSRVTERCTCVWRCSGTALSRRSQSGTLGPGATVG